MQSNRFYFLILVFIFLLSCKKNQQKKDYINEKMNINSEKIAKAKQNVNSISKIDDTIKISNKHKINTIKCDLDGDKLDETIQIVRNTKNKKSGLRIIYGNRKRIDFLGLGKDILNQGFDEIDQHPSANRGIKHHKQVIAYDSHYFIKMPFTSFRL